MATEGRYLYQNPATYQANEAVIDPDSSYLLKEGMSHMDLVDVKMKLNWLGYGQSKITTKFGPYFKEQVMKFQEDYGLASTGMVDYRTKRKISEAFSIAFRPDSKFKRVRRFKSALERLGFGEISSNEQLKRCLMDFQVHYQLKVTGSLDLATFSKMNKILSTSFQAGEEHQDIISLKSKLTSLGYGRIKLTPKFGKRTERMVKKFQQDYGLLVSGIADELTMEKLNTAQRIKEKVTYSRYEFSFNEILEEQHIDGAEIGDHPIMLNPNNFVNDEKMKFLFTDLFRPNVTSANELNNLLVGKGNLEGQGQVISDIANEWGINELFLLSRIIGDKHESLIQGKVDPKITINRIAKKMMDEFGPLNNTLYKAYFNPDSFQAMEKKVNSDAERITGLLDDLYETYQAMDSYTLHLEIPVFKDRPVEKYIRG
ncbi:peptidoglycan-binding protein [Thalassobacillus sp. B23F22_16]|uniref:peptidoglycan-binding protein n=1 Tax=Thalassobacillus sp. B23F22_16 TaxID=3459513 RepID=UPI00373F241F